MRKVVIIKGVSLALGLSLFLLGLAFCQALLDHQPVNYLSGYTRCFTAVSLIAGGFYAGYRWLQRGWLAGGTVGFIYCLTGLICSIFLIPRTPSVLDLFNALIPGTILSGMAGVCGVNIGRAQRKQFRSTASSIKKRADT